jgi:4-nitrophenyl phosphatase
MWGRLRSPTSPLIFFIQEVGRCVANHLNKSKVKTMIKGLILDMDGVLWRGAQPIGDLAHVFARIEQLELRVTLATNNATLTIAQYQEKLAGMGARLEAWQIVNSPAATGHYLQQRFPQGGAVYIVGEAGLAEAMQAHGFTISDVDPCAVVVGLDRTLTYEKLFIATQLVRAGALFVATNPDRTLPVPQGFAPGAGAIVAALQAATDVSPVVVGKPFPGMYGIALERMGLDASETLVVGDRIETDIIGAQELGCKTALVLSGVSTRVEGQIWQPPIDFIESDLTALLESLAEGVR